jgi:phosphotransferase system  glucose/maltose/N-acetylglucosamine-specific IIC component
LRETFWCIPHGNGLVFSSFFNFLKTIQKNETPKQKNEKEKKKKKTKKEEKK